MKLDNGKAVRITKTGVRVGNGKVCKTLEAVTKLLDGLNKGERRRIKKALFKAELKHLIPRANTTA